MSITHDLNATPIFSWLLKEVSKHAWLQLYFLFYFENRKLGSDYVPCNSSLWPVEGSEQVTFFAKTILDKIHIL